MKNNIVVVGAMLVSQNAEMLDITIPNLLKYSNWILLLMDNESEEVEEKVYEYQKKYYDKIFVRRSTVPKTIIGRNGKPISYRMRSKSTKGMFRDDVFVCLNRILSDKKKGYDKIDILLWPDSDEIFTSYLPELLEKFWKSGKRAVMTKPADVVHNMKTLKTISMGHHVHILRYAQDFSAYPWAQFAVYHPLTRKDIMKAQYYSVHLAYLNDEIMKWRSENWKNDDLDRYTLVQLDKSVEHMSPVEITNALKNKS